MEEEHVRALLREQHPDLAGLALLRVDGGWDNQMWRLGDELAVRLPRTERGPALLETEWRWAPELARRLPLPISAPVRFGAPSDRFPHAWLVTSWVEGQPADRAEVRHGVRSAEILAAFLAALHREAPSEAPANPDRGVPLERFAEETERNLEGMANDPRAARMRESWDDALAAREWDRAPVWIHGDLHPANVVTADGALAGVIDFGELCAGDPATDLSAAWLLLPEGGAERFFDAYAADEDTVRRARGWALRRSFGLLHIGRAGEAGLLGGKPTWKRAGEAALERVLAA